MSGKDAESRSYFICYGASLEQQKALLTIAERFGIFCLTVASMREIRGLNEKYDHVVGFVIIGNPRLAKSISTQKKKAKSAGPENKQIPVISVPKKATFSELCKKIDDFIMKMIPLQILELVQGVIQKIPDLVFGVDIGQFEKTVEFNHSYSHRASCNTMAEGFFMRVSVEIDIPRLKSTFPSLSSKEEWQLIDSAAETCNQILGVINSNLRNSGLQPKISLPNKVQFDSHFGTHQCECAPFLKFVDAKEIINIGILLEIDPNCSANWDQLAIEPMEADIQLL